MSDSHCHPERRQLEAYNEGDLPPGLAAELEAHLLQCADCCHYLRRLPEPQFLQRVRAAAGLTLNNESVEESRRSLEQTPFWQEGNTPTGISAIERQEQTQQTTPLKNHPRYEILGELGKGGMGVVFRARNRTLGKEVALKVLRPGLLEDKTARERFRHEAQAVGRMSHPNIVTAIDAEDDLAFPFLVFELVDGQNLGDLVRHQGPLPVDVACRYAQQVARGLQHALEHGAVHRDLKPHNLMLTAEGQVKILDFGLSRVVSELGTPQRLTQPGGVMGTPDYMAPEQQVDARSADIRADIYSLGCTLYEFLTGQPPFAGVSDLQKLFLHRTSQPQPVQQIQPEIPEKLARLLDRLLAKDPAQRPQTPLEVAQALEPFTHPPQSPTIRTRRPRVKARLLALAALWFLMVAGVVIYIQTDQGTLVIESTVPGIEILIEPEHKTVQFLDKQTQQVVRLRSGKHGIHLLTPSADVQVDVPQVVLRRGDTEIVRVTKRPNEPASLPPPSDYRPPAPGTPLVLVCRLKGHTGRIVALAISDNHQRVLSSSTDGTTRLWDATNGKQLNRFSWTSRGICLSPDGQLAASIHEQHDASDQDRRVFVWDMQTGRKLHTLEGHQDTVCFAGFTPDGQRLITRSGSDLFNTDLTMRVWDVKRGTSIFPPLPAGYPGPWTFMKQGREIVAATRDGFRVFSMESGKLLSQGGGGLLGNITSLTVRQNGKYLVTARDLRESVFLDDLNEGNVTLYQVPEGPRGGPVVSYLDPETGRYLLVWVNTPQREGTAAMIFDVPARKEIWRARIPMAEIVKGTTSRDMSAVAGRDHVIHVWKLPS